MLWKRQIPILIVAVIGTLTLFGWFVNEPHIKSFVDDDATQWFDILASFAIFLGGFNLLKMQLQKVIRKQQGWQYSIFAIVGFFFAIIAGFFYKGNPDVAWGTHVTADGTLFKWIFTYMFAPLQATMFALLAFFVASASYRAFRIRNFEATLLLVAGIILMLGRVPIGDLIPWWVVAILIVFGIGAISAPWIKDKKILFGLISGGIIIFLIAGFTLGWNQEPPQILLITVIQDWIFDYPTTAGSRALMIGIALGVVGTSFRIILGMERSFLGE